MHLIFWEQACEIMISSRTTLI